MEINWDLELEPDIEMPLSVFRGPIVYAMMREGEWLYVGVSAYGMERPADVRHASTSELTSDPAVIIKVWTFPDELSARRHERRMIKQHKPYLNIKGIISTNLGKQYRAKPGVYCRWCSSPGKSCCRPCKVWAIDQGLYPYVKVGPKARRLWERCFTPQ